MRKRGGYIEDILWNFSRKPNFKSDMKGSGCLRKPMDKRQRKLSLGKAKIQ